MPVVNLSPLGGAGWQFFTDSGVPLAGGLIYTYAAGTTTPAVTYTSATGVTANTNPIVLDAAGRPPNEIWLAAISYKFVLKDSNGVQIWSMDNLSGLPAAGTQSYQTATQGQTVFVGLTYTLGNNSLKVFVNGSKQVVTLNYNETTANSITFLTGLNVGDIVEFLQ
jgi:hypothetical protein